MLEMIELGEDLIALLKPLTDWLESSVTLPLPEVVAGETVGITWLTFQVRDWLVGGGVITILVGKFIKFIWDVVPFV